MQKYIESGKNESDFLSRNVMKDILKYIESIREKIKNLIVGKTNMQIVLKYFNYKEFDSPDKKGSGKKYMDKDFLIRLDHARSIAGVPFKINSGYRTVKHNIDVGGVPESSHCKGNAVDISVNSSKDRLLILSALMETQFKRIGIGKNFIHCDSDSQKENAIWTYY